MAMPMIATELTKIAVGKLAEIRPDDVAKAARAISKAAGRGSLLVPGLGAFGVGLLVGTGIGYLTAPRAGQETRARLVESIKRRFGALSQKLRAQAAEAEAAPAPAPASEESVGRRSNGGSAPS